MSENPINLVESVPDDVYIKFTNYLSVNDIETLAENNVDTRTDLAFDKLQHAVIYETIDSSYELMNPGFGNRLSSLPSLIKSITIYNNGKLIQLDRIFDDHFGLDGFGNFARKFPNLEKLDVQLTGSVLSYLKNIGQPSNLKSITIDFHAGVEIISEILDLSPKLKQLTFAINGYNLDIVRQLMNKFEQCTNVEQLIVVLKLRRDFGTLKIAIKSFPNLKTLTIDMQELITWESQPLNEFIHFCGKQSFKTQLVVRKKTMPAIDDTNRQLIVTYK